MQQTLCPHRPPPPQRLWYKPNATHAVTFRELFKSFSCESGGGGGTLAQIVTQQYHISDDGKQHCNTTESELTRCNSISEFNVRSSQTSRFPLPPPRPSSSAASPSSSTFPRVASTWPALLAIPLTASQKLISYVYAYFLTGHSRSQQILS